jgi:hypothetical protein
MCYAMRSKPQVRERGNKGLEGGFLGHGGHADFILVIGVLECGLLRF